jgi:aspartate kinase
MQRSVSILKFGGTSVGNGERIRQVASIVVRQAEQSKEGFPVVVVSAMAGVTDQLLRITRTLIAHKTEEYVREIEALKLKHRQTARQVASEDQPYADLLTALESAFTRLEGDTERLRTVRDCAEEIPLRTAAVAAWGERLSVLLVAAAIRDTGVVAEAVREEVIVIETPHSEIPYLPGTVIGAEPLTGHTRENAARLVVPLLERGVIPVVAGFIGRTTDGLVATLGRNGSDYSAAVIGAALDCQEVEIFTDVDGVLTADPRIVPNARLLPHLSYVEAAQLSWFGAKVLHPRTLIPLATRNVPVRVRNTFRPQGRGTLVGPVGKQSSSATAITVRRHLALITVESRHLFGAQENVGEIFALAARAGITPVAICSSSGHHLAFMVEEKMADSVVELLQYDLENWQVTSRKGLAACACIGSGFVNTPMSPARAVTALAHEHIPVVTQGASDQGIILIVEDQDSDSALRSLHRELIAPVIPLVRHHHHMQEKRREAL